MFLGSAELKNPVLYRLGLLEETAGPLDGVEGSLLGDVRLDLAEPLGQHVLMTIGFVLYEVHGGGQTFER